MLISLVPRYNSTIDNDHDHDLKFPSIQAQHLSQLIPYAGLILTCIVCVLVIIRLYVLDGFLFPRFYGKIYKDMNDDTRRTFVNHHIGGLLKLVVVFGGCYPWTMVLFVTDKDYNTPMAAGSRVTCGDVLLVLTQIFVAMYVFELLIRTKLSPIAMLHHVGAVTIAQVAVALSIRYAGESHGERKYAEEAAYEYLLCMVWGAFDVLAEFWPNVAIILYRVKNNDHKLLKKVFLYTSVITVMGTTGETILIFIFMASVWTRLSVAFKVTTAILHCIFMAAQIHGSRILFKMYKVQKAKLAALGKSEEVGRDVESQDGGKGTAIDQTAVPKEE